MIFTAFLLPLMIVAAIRTITGTIEMVRTCFWPAVIRAVESTT